MCGVESTFRISLRSGDERWERVHKLGMQLQVSLFRGAAAYWGRTRYMMTRLGLICSRAGGVVWSGSRDRGNTERRWRERGRVRVRDLCRPSIRVDTTRGTRVLAST